MIFSFVRKNRLISGEISSVYYNMLRKDGSTFPAEITSSVMRNSMGTPTGFVIVYRAINERTEASEELRNSTKR